MTLEAFQSGLSWLIILRKRENFRRAFSGFDIEKVAGYTDADVQRLMADAGIVRNRAKIEATIANARVAADLDPPKTCPSCCGRSRRRPRPRPADVIRNPCRPRRIQGHGQGTQKGGFRFVGPTTAYALMQATGMVDDHIRALLGAFAGSLRAVGGLQTGSCASGHPDREQWRR